MRHLLRMLSCLFLCAGFSMSQAGELKWDDGNPDVTTLRRLVGQATPFGLDQLFETKAYPTNENAVHSFYAEATIVVDFLTQTADRRALLPKFIDAMISNNDVDAALRLYGYQTRADFKKAYDRYRTPFPRR